MSGERIAGEASRIMAILRNVIGLVRPVLALPAVYTLFQNLIGYDSAMRWFVGKHVRPFGGMRLLDIGCGPGTVLEYLPDDIDYVGVDVSAEYIEHARKKYGRRARFICLDVGGSLPASLRNFDRVTAIGVFHHLDDETARTVFALAADRLGEKGCLVSIDPAWYPGQSSVARCIIGMDRGRYVRSPQEIRSFAEEYFSSVSAEIEHRALRIPYTHCILNCSRANAPDNKQGEN